MIFTTILIIINCSGTNSIAPINNFPTHLLAPLHLRTQGYDSGPLTANKITSLLLVCPMGEDYVTLNVLNGAAREGRRGVAVMGAQYQWCIKPALTLVNHLSWISSRYLVSSAGSCRRRERATVHQTIWIWLFWHQGAVVVVYQHLCCRHFQNTKEKGCNWAALN